MSQATLRALVGVILSGSGTSGINFRINGTHIQPGHFARLQAAIRAEKINFLVDGPGLAKLHAEAAYNSRTKTMIMRPSAVQAASDIPLQDRAVILHEAFHAICDMDRIDSLSPTQEEACGALCGCLYVLLQYGRIWTKDTNGPLISVCRRIRADPGMEVWTDSDFLEVYERVYKSYRKSSTVWGKVSNYRTGL